MDATTKANLIELFTKTVDGPEFAKYTRRFMLECIKLMLEDTNEIYNKAWISEGHYHLNQLCEILDPQLEK